MSENPGHFTLYGRSPLFQLVFTLLIIATIGIALLLIMVTGGLLISGLDFNSLSDNFLGEIGEKHINLLRYLMISQEIALFVIPALIVRKLLIQPPNTSLNDFRFPYVNEIVIVIVLAFCVFPLTWFTGQLNAEMKLPEWLSGVEHWMRTQEDNATNVIELLVPQGSGWVLIVNLVIVSLMPAISEELLFRGVFQRIFCGFFKTCHPAIVITAFIFSSVHFQFYGFIPRFILGLVFGYLYYWGRTLWLPVTAHLVNNAVPVIAAYFQSSDSSLTVPDVSLWKQLVLLPVPVTLIIVILLYFRNRNADGSAPKTGLNQGNFQDQV